jgi:hypothetical protein
LVDRKFVHRILFGRIFEHIVRKHIQTKVLYNKLRVNKFNDKNESLAKTAKILSTGS